MFLGFFKSLGVDYLFDISFARCFSIIEAQKEFIERYQKKNEDATSLPMLTSACPGKILLAWNRFLFITENYPVGGV